MAKFMVRKIEDAEDRQLQREEEEKKDERERERR